jgi:hypothetical protein
VLRGFRLDSTFNPGSYQLRVDKAGRQVELRTKEEYGGERGGGRLAGP